METKEKLIVVTSQKIIADLRALDNGHLVYPLESFCVGFTQEFPIEEIDDYVLINRLLTDQDLQKLSTILAKASIKGIIFDDLGVIDLVKDYHFPKILMLNHLGNNYQSLNYYLDYVDSIITSSDITKEELNDILLKSKKPLVLNTFGLVPLMYSRRLLLTNYSQHNKLLYQDVLDTTINDKDFKIIENNYGTVIYTQKYYYLEDYLKYSNVLAYYFNPVFLSDEEVIKVLQGDLAQIKTFAFLQNDFTYFKIKGDDK